MKFLSHIYFALTYILLPVFIFLSALFLQLTGSNYYVRVLKNADLIENYINTEKWQTEEKIKKEIDEKVHLEKYRNIHESLKKQYENKQKTYAELNKDDEFEQLNAEKKKIENLTYRQAPLKIRTPEEFNKYRKEESERIDTLIAGIEDYRKENKYLLKKVIDELDELKDDYDDAEDTLKEKEKEARKIILSHEDSFKGQIVADLKKIDPVLTYELNARLIDGQVKDVINGYINYFSDYYTNKETGNIYTDTFDDYVSGGNLLHITLPESSVSLYVDYESGGFQKKHLLSEIFVEKIREIKDLKNPKVFQKAFLFTESRLGEMLGRSYLGNAGINLKNGVITIKERELVGRGAEIMKFVMLSFTWSKYLKYAFPALAVVIIISLFFAGERIKRRNRIRRIFKYTSLLMIIACCLLMFLASSVPSVLKMDALSLGSVFLKSILNNAAINLLMPAVIVFLVLFVAGFFLKKKKAVG